MKKEFPKGMKHLGVHNCATCRNINKVVKTKTAYCSQHSITFPIYEGTEYYVCDDHTPLVGEWESSVKNFIKKETE